jgi:hypothetical protein
MMQNIIYCSGAYGELSGLNKDTCKTTIYSFTCIAGQNCTDRGKTAEKQKQNICNRYKSCCEDWLEDSYHSIVLLRIEIHIYLHCASLY